MNWIAEKVVKSIRNKVGYSPSKIFADMGNKIFIGLTTGRLNAEMESIQNKRLPYRYGKVHPTQPYLPYPYSIMKSLKEWYWYY